MQSLLLTGQNPDTRATEAKIVAQNQSSKFDQIFIDTAETKGIVAIKELLAQASRKPFQSKILTVIIFEANRLTPEAQNSLLKSLEEPSNSLQFILTAPSRDSVLPTIASRCLEFRLAKPQGLDTENFDLESSNKFSQNLSIIEKTGLDDQLLHWTKILEKKATQPESSSFNLKSLHRYNKTLLKLKKAEGLSVNKKLLSLIAALEAPESS